MQNLWINANITVTDDTDINALRQRAADTLRTISNPVRSDQGILTVNTVQISPDASARILYVIYDDDSSTIIGSSDDYDDAVAMADQTDARILTLRL